MNKMAPRLLPSTADSVSSPPTLIHHLIERLAVTSPHSVAFADPSTQTSVTYSCINKAANVLAERILEITKGQLELPVALLLQSRIQIIIASLATLKAGCAFVPLSLSYPLERIQHILSDLSVGNNNQDPLIIVEDETASQEWKRKLKSQAIIPFGNKNIISQNGNDINLDSIKPNNLAYIIYTSGSTGQPKGVMVEHGSLVYRLTTFIESHCINSKDVGVLFLNPAFDASLLETWGILGGGGRLIQLPDKVKTDPTSFLGFVRNHQVTRVVLPASFAERVWKIEGQTDDLDLKLKTMFIGGEQLAAFPYLANLPYHVINCYGPTETTIQVTTMNLSTMHEELEHFDGNPVGVPPIGFPVPGVKLTISDQDGGNEDVGGELWIGGRGLARGYWNNPTLTGQKFVTLAGTGERWYRSGDLVRQAREGYYFWLSRIDDQVKVNGFLVEPAEVEHVILSQLGDVVNLVKVAVFGKRILAFVVLHNSEDNPNLRERLAPHIPNYLLPTFFIPLPSLPLTINGKVDKGGLEKEYALFLKKLANNNTTASNPYESVHNNSSSPGSLIGWEKSIAKIWSKVLNLPESVVNTAQDIFQIGGDSLDISQFGALLKQQFGLEKLPYDLLLERNSLNLRKMAGVVANVAKEQEQEKKKMLFQQQTDNHQYPSNLLVPLGTETNNPDAPLIIFLHPEAGTLFCYNALIHRLCASSKKYRCYGFQDGVYPGESLAHNFSSLKEMATYYVSVLEKKFFSEGGDKPESIVLCGYGSGGYLAWEMAAQLEYHDCNPTLFLFDTHSNNRLTNYEGDTELLIDSYKSGRRNHNGVKVPEQVVAEGAQRLRLGLNYQPTPLLLNKSQQVMFFKGSNENNNQMVDEDWWANFTKGPGQITFYNINSHRDLMLEEPNVVNVTKVMTECID